MTISLHYFISVIVLVFTICQKIKSDNLDDILNDQWNLIATTYLRHNDTKIFLDLMKESFPESVNYYSIGESVEGYELLVARLGNTVDKPDNERPPLVPKMNMVAGIHGDETLGKQLLLMLIIDLVKNKRENDERAKRILEETELHLLLSMNPDGYEVVNEGECSPDEENLGRLNTNLVDLNRDFKPYRTLGEESEANAASTMQPEVRHVMQWIHDGQFVLSLSLFGGDIVASYPRHGVPPKVEEEGVDPALKGPALTSKTDDDETFVYLANLYASNHKTMTAGDNCERAGLFKNGIINGAEWNDTLGTMADYNYHESFGLEISVSLSCCKAVEASTFVDEWENNKESLYKYIEAVHLGIKGVVTKGGQPLPYAWVQVKDEKKAFHTSDRSNERGEYWRVVVPGDYTVVALDGGEKSEEVQVKVEESDPSKATIQHLEIIVN